jgi:hypothetical protein
MSFTASRRSASGKAELQRRLAALIAASQTSAGWTAEGFRPDLNLLGRVLSLTDPRDVRGGSVATGLDLWTAATLRQAGLQHVVPRESEPFFTSRLASVALPAFDAVDGALRDLSDVSEQLKADGHVVEHGIVRRSVRTLAVRLRALRQELERATTSVLGESRRKQVDVFMADWDRGLELVVSTKTFALATDIKEIVKNLPNRWEEFDGDLKNLRGRFPLAVIGALIVIPEASLHGALPAFVDMMTKLTAPGRPWVNAYDRAAIIVADWPSQPGGETRILNDTLDSRQLPAELQPWAFFDALLTLLLERAPITEHRLARAASARSRGEDPSAIQEAIEAEETAFDT